MKDTKGQRHGFLPLPFGALMIGARPKESFDVAIVGGSFAGVSAAMQLARARRRVLLVHKPAKLEVVVSAIGKALATGSAQPEAWTLS